MRTLTPPTLLTTALLASSREAISHSPLVGSEWKAEQESPSMMQWKLHMASVLKVVSP